MLGGLMGRIAPIAVTIRDWMSKGYVKAALGTAAAIFGAEFLSTMASDMVKPGVGRFAVKEIIRFITSALAYFGLRNINPAIALTASVAIAGIALADIPAYVLGHSPETLAKKMEMWLGLAQTSAAITGGPTGGQPQIGGMAF